jgi:hypothetical protein
VHLLFARLRRQRERAEARDRPRPDGAEVRQHARERLAADEVEALLAAPEVDVLDRLVRLEHEPVALRRADHRGVVADAGLDGGAVRRGAHQVVDDRLLAERHRGPVRLHARRSAARAASTARRGSAASKKSRIAATLVTPRRASKGRWSRPIPPSA